MVSRGQVQNCFLGSLYLPAPSVDNVGYGRPHSVASSTNTNRLNKSLFTGKLVFLSDCLLFDSGTKCLTETVHTYIHRAKLDKTERHGRSGQSRKRALKFFRSFRSIFALPAAPSWGQKRFEETLFCFHSLFHYLASPS